MSKTITISDEAAEILESLVRDGRFEDVSQAAAEAIHHLASEEYDPEFVAGLEEAIRQANAREVVPYSPELIRKIFDDARKRIETNSRR